jgi:hypothetical protein
MGHRVGLGLLVAGVPLLWVVPLGGSITMAVGALCWAISSEVALDQPEEMAALAVVPLSSERP